MPPIPVQTAPVRFVNTNPVRFVHPKGNDGADGLTLETAKQTIYAAYDSMSTLSYDGGPGGGTIYIYPASAVGNEESGGGIWLTSENPPPPGWRTKNKSISFVGLGDHNDSFATRPEAYIAGVAADKPVIQLYNVSGVYFENFQFYNQQILIGPSSAGANNGVLDNIFFRNCTFRSPTDRVGLKLTNGFWIWFDQCTFLNSQSPALTDESDPKWDCILLDPQPDSGLLSLIDIADCRFASGVLRSTDISTRSIRLRRLVFESDFTRTLPPAVQLNNANPYTVVDIDGIDVADSPPPPQWQASTSYAADAAVVPTPYKQRGLYFKATSAGVSSSSEPSWPNVIGGSVTDGGVTWVSSGYSPQPTVRVVPAGPSGPLDNIAIRNVAKVEGPALLNGMYTLGWGFETTSPNAKEQVGLWRGGRNAGPQEAGRRQIGVSAVRYPNLVDNRSANWPVDSIGTTVLSAGHLAPDGSHGAYKLVATGVSVPTYGARKLLSSSIALTEGDAIAFSVWIRGDIDIGNGGSASAVSIFATKLTYDGYIASNAPILGDGEWNCMSGAFHVVRKTGVTDPAPITETVTLQVLMQVLPGFPLYFYGPSLIRLPYDEVSRNEAAEIAANNGPTAFGAPVGAAALLPDQDIFLPRHVLSGGAVLSISASAGAGTGPSVSVVGNDFAGTITVTTGTGSAAGALATVTFANAFATAPSVVLTAANSNTGRLKQYVVPSSTNFDVGLDASEAPVDATTYKWSYLIVG